MRNKYYFSLFMCFFAWMMFNGVTSSSGKSGKSGAPGESTCIQCHSTNALNDPSGSISMSVAGVTNGQYTAGQTYQVSVTVSKMGQSLFGFSVSALNAAGQNAGSLVAGTDSHAELSSESGTSRNYITHNSNGGLANNQKTFTFSWTAPASGNVNFYFTGLAANNNGSNTGDYVYSSNMTLSQSTVAQTRIIAGEYFWGTIDPGVGTGTAFTATDGNFSDVIESIIASAQSVPNLSSPVLLNVRVKDVNNNWGPRFRKVIFLTSNTPTANNVAVTQGEFFFGSTDPGQGSATPLVVFDGNWGEAVEAATSLNTAWSLTPGLHLFNVRAKDGSNKWGPLFKKTISVQGVPANPRLCKIQSAEFFFGATDPGQGNGTNLLVLDDNWSDAIETAVSSNTTWNLSNGLTLFNVRVKDETNKWGPLFKKTLSIQGTPIFRNLTVQAAEFFFGTFDPGAGSATAILAFDGDYNAAIEQAFADDYAWSITGNSALFNIRFKDETNKWGPLFKKTVFRNETPNGRTLNITFAEYYFGVFDPGAGNGSVIVAFDGNFDNAVETLLRNHLTWENQSGSTLFNIRVKDGANKWGPVFKRTIFFNGANPAVNLITEGETVSRCPTFPVTLTYAGPQGFNVTWENGTVGNTVTFVPDGSGYFSMTAQLGNEYLFDSIYVNVYELPPAVVDPTGEILVCQSSTVYLNVNTAPNFTYQWYFNDAVIPGSTQPTILPTEVGAYKVLVTNNTTTCQQMSLPTTFYLTAPIFPSGTVSTVCNPNGVTLTAPTSPSNTYQWKKNGANISGATGATYLATTPGNYQVTVNSGSCVSTSPVTTVSSTGTTVVAAILPSGTQNLCTGQVLTLNATTGTGYTFQWNKDGVAINGATQSSYIADTPGVYTCTVSANGCTLTSNATTINLGDAVTPSVAITADASTVCSGTAVNFTATPTNGGTSPTYQWKKNGVNISGATSATYALTTPANNDAISVVMTSNNSCQSTNTSNSNSVSLTVTNSVTPTVAITTGTTSICAGTSVQFTSSITNGGTTPAYQWKKNGVNISGATLSSYTTTSLVNSDVITLQLTSNASCVSTATVASNAITMTVNESVTPIVQISASSTTVCANGAVVLTATPTNGGTNPTFQWIRNGINISGANSPIYTLPSPANNDVITLVMTSNAACTSTTLANSNSLTITVTNSVVPSVSITADASTVCSGTAVNFTATPTNGGTSPTYQWKKNGVNISGATSATYALTAPANNDAISVVMTSNNSCQSTNTSTSNVVTVMVTNAVTPTVAITTGTTSICAGTSVQFISSITNGGTTPAYQWKKNGVNVNGATLSSYTTDALASGDVITLQLTSNASCVSNAIATSNAITMTVNASVNPSVLVSANNTTVCAGSSVNFTATPANGGTTPTYQWKKNGVNISGAISSTYTLAAPANNDAISVVMTSNAACASTASATSNAITITVSSSIVPSVSITADASTVCSGTSVNFTATSTNGGTSPTYQWKKNGVNISGATSATYALTAPANNDAISVVMTSNNSCQSTNTSNSNSVSLTVTNSVTPTVAITTGTTSICAGTSVQFISSITNGGTTPAYQWKKNGVNVNGATLSSYTTDALASGDVITLQLTSNASCVSNAIATSNALTMTVNSAITYYQDLDGDGFGNGSVTSLQCTMPSGYTLNSGDCDDSNANVNPSVEEVCSNGMDDNCSGEIDENCSVFGCTDIQACNFNPLATNNDQTCIYPELYYNCEGNCISDTDNDGVCNELEIAGCSDVVACNYNELATDNSGCIYAEVGYDCQGNCLVDSDNDGVCDAFEIIGCIDETACNFDATATNEGNCTYPEQGFDCDGNCLNDQDGDGVCDEFEVLGCTNPSACNFNPSATDNDGSCIASQPEICNQLDDDCDGVVDNGVQYFDYYLDNDGDGYGDAFMENTCSSPSNSAWVLESGDCQDDNVNVYPTQLEACNNLDDNCNDQIDEGVSPGSIQAVTAITNAYPTCTGNGLKAANFAVGFDSPITVGAGTDLWYSFTAQHTSFRAGLSAAYGDNSIELYVQQGNCMVLLDTEHEVTTGNQILYNDELNIGTTYYVACRHFSGANNPSAKMCFNHFIGSACDHYYSNNTGIYNTVCTAFKAAYRANAAQYTFAVESATQNAQPMTITPWSYTTTTSNSVVSRLGMILPVNNTGSAIVYGMKVGVVYAMTDAAGNSESVVAPGTTACQTTLNSEATISLRSADRCPTYKAISSSVSVDRTVCGAQRYQWEFTQTLPTAGTPVTVLGGLYSAVLFLNNVPGIAAGRTYNVRVRAQHSSGLYGEWGATQCLRTSGTGMALLDSEETMVALSNQTENDFAIYPNPSANGQFTLVWKTSSERELNMKVWDLSGKLVADQSAFMNGQIWESKQMDLASGIYFVEVNGQRQRWVLAQ